MHALLPGNVDDPASPSGGNTYDRRVCDGLDSVREITISGTWPRPDADARAELARALAGCPDDAVVLIDGLVACGVPDIVVPEARRLRLAVLLHLPLADEPGAEDLDAGEGEVLRAARVVVVTGPSMAARLTGVREVRTVVPGTDPAPVASGTDGVSQLLCVASLTPRKGHDVLVEALATLTDLPWRCDFVGPVPDSAHTRRVASMVEKLPIRITGPLVGAALAEAYDRADLFVLPSRAETFGMVVTEALARGIPVMASSAPDALGDGGLSLTPGDAGELAAALRDWLTDSALRDRLRAAALRRRGQLDTWEQSTREMADVLASLRT
ncbi:glycosyltransferase family 4 protein [Actinokineospora sp. HUAS TT18]|uniref:glycosyltransferase family 4 protein n=1 Tax=Actinokineospora sp. HUAS TT18 TaxID=3447451 RepID=UPI003F5277BF